jgi:hypothetical protein
MSDWMPKASMIPDNSCVMAIPHAPGLSASPDFKDIWTVLSKSVKLSAHLSLFS